jgi:undecaprenyl-diphosphatase
MVLRHEIFEAARDVDPRQILALTVATAPTAVVGYVGQGWIETRLGTPATIAAGLFVGAVAMALADTSPQRRTIEELSLLDATWIGAAQSLALVPGISRSGITLSAARSRSFRRADSERLALAVGLPATVGIVLHGVWQIRSGAGKSDRSALRTGALASFASTILSHRLLRRLRWSGRPLAPFAAYRAALAVLIVWELTRRRENDLTQSALARR